MLSILALGAAAAAAVSSPGPGVPLSLARERASRVSDVRYELAFSLPASTAAAVTGSETLSFELADASAPLALDFRTPAGTAVTITAKGRPVRFAQENEHLILPPQELARGRNVLRLDFTADDAPLNRHDDFLYTLLVPARARELFPCFDQPDLKGLFDLTLELPSEWKAVANGAELSRRESGGRATLRFSEPPRLSTYLFAFAAGRFEVETARRGSRELRFFHRDGDRARVARSREAFFDLTAQALDWMAGYTEIGYPWGKLDAVLLPGFQYSGMEHPGAIWYRADRVLLDDGPTQDQRLRRANLIGHEVAHMWFGDLVTMRWFDDVWLKEVFANFMAAKAVEPGATDADAALRFLMQNQAGAYAVEATAGTHPIQQPLENLAEAGSLYGPIIYQKAPVVMRQLELALGERAFAAGMRNYLRKFSFGNATWDDLIDCLQQASGARLEAFSRAWVKEAGRPVVRARWDGTDLVVEQSDPSGKGRVWEQTIETAVYGSSGTKAFAARLAGTPVRLRAVRGPDERVIVIPDRSGLGYASFQLDAVSRELLLGGGVSRLPEAAARGAAWLSLWEDLLEGRLSGRRYLDAAQAALESERAELNVQRLLDTSARAYWRYLPAAERLRRAPALEALLWRLAESAPTASLKRAFAKAYWNVAQTDAGTRRLRELWAGGQALSGLTLSEDDKTSLALELAVRGAPDAASVLERQRASLTDPDRRARLDFLAPAVSADAAARGAFFESLSQRGNRRREAWVADALRYLHHPLRAESSEAFVTPALELLEEVARTGDIFFPSAWVSATLEGHSSARAARTVRSFLEARPRYPERLKRVVLQSLYGLESASRPTTN